MAAPSAPVPSRRSSSKVLRDSDLAGVGPPVSAGARPLRRARARTGAARPARGSGGSGAGLAWRRFFRHIVASALYFENWQLAIDSQIPRRADLESTPVQHFWSLSVEEQFYLVWPLLLIAAFAVAARAGVGGRRTAFALLALVSAASFAHSVLLTGVDANLAYFGTFARTWEFGVGGLLALVPLPRHPRSDPVLAAAGFVGIALIAVPIASFRSPELFPGLVVLLPVAGTALVIAGGMPTARWAPTRLAALGPVQWLGDVSYSLYLWHWPVFMFVPYVTGMPSPPWAMVLLVLLSLAVAGLSKRCIEDPFRAGRGAVAARPRLALGGVATAVAIVVGAGVAAPAIAAERITACEAPGR
ncbi:acyltransferase family protein [Agromyces soli]